MKFNIWKYITFILIVGLIALGAYYFYFIPSSPAKTIETFNRNLCDGKVDEAMKHLSSSIPFPSEFMKIALGTSVQKCKESGGFKEIEVTSENIVGEIAYVKGYVKFNGSIIESFDMKLFLEDGRWKIAWKGNS